PLSQSARGENESSPRPQFLWQGTSGENEGVSRQSDPHDRPLAADRRRRLGAVPTCGQNPAHARRARAGLGLLDDAYRLAPRGIEAVARFGGDDEIGRRSRSGGPRVRFGVRSRANQSGDLMEASPEPGADGTDGSRSPTLSPDRRRRMARTLQRDG